MNILDDTLYPPLENMGDICAISIMEKRYSLINLAFVYGYPFVQAYLRDDL